MPQSGRYYVGKRLSSLPVYNFLTGTQKQTLLGSMNAQLFVQTSCARSILPCDRSAPAYRLGQDKGPPFIPREALPPAGDDRESPSTEGRSAASNASYSTAGAELALGNGQPDTLAFASFPVAYEELVARSRSTKRQYFLPLATRTEPSLLAARVRGEGEGEKEGDGGGGNGGAVTPVPGGPPAVTEPAPGPGLCRAYHGRIGASVDASVAILISTSVSVQSFGGGAGAAGAAWLYGSFTTTPVSYSITGGGPCTHPFCREETEMEVAVKYSLDGQLRIYLRADLAVGMGPFEREVRARGFFGLDASWEEEIVTRIPASGTGPNVILDELTPPT